MQGSKPWQWNFKDPGPIPDVSIVICAHGKSDITLQCLESLNRNQHFNHSRAEVILVDDASPDDTVNLTKDIRGLRLIELTENVGFLRAANTGMIAARGRNILFLNNDTEQVGRWLDPLLGIFDRRPKALVAGSRLIYPDGRLQEAGGIIFSDGSGWNYGRGMDLCDPRFTFEREVDYVSGASLLVRGDYLRARGGFDDHYAPAYYEDTDLCFAAREDGGEVWYQPASIVIHHEGQSHGVDETTGIKSFQPINRERFLGRWSKVLENHSPSGAHNVPVARQRVRLGRILLLDHEMPAPDRDSGSTRITAIMRTMLDLGFSVTFLPVNGWRREPYVSQLEELGVEVLGEPSLWREHLGHFSQGVTHIWISRPEVAARYLSQLRVEMPHAKIIYDTVDLHFLRMEREAEVTMNPSLRPIAANKQVQELDLMAQADVTVVVSPFEQSMLTGLTASSVVVVPNIHCVNSHPAISTGRDGLLFVGGFRHTPNVDAMVWFVREVLPLICESAPHVHLTIVGSDATSAILELASDTVTVAGWIPDTMSLYESARIAVAPLRYGAGVKGKVGEALSLGVPMVMTSIASEGMHILDRQHALVSDTSEEFAKSILELMSDDHLWQRISAAGQALIHERFGVDATRELVEQALAAGTRTHEYAGVR